MYAEGLIKVKIEDYIEDVVMKGRVMDHSTSFSILIVTLTVGYLVAKLVGLSLMNTLYIQVIIGILVTEMVWLARKKLINKLVDKKYMKRLRGFIVETKGLVKVISIEDDLYDNESIKKDAGSIYLKIIKSAINKVFLVLICYGFGVYTIDIGSFNLFYLQQILLLIVTYVLVCFFYKYEKRWSDKGINKIVRKIVVFGGLSDYLKNNTLGIEEYWLNIYANLYHKKEILYHQDEEIKEKEDMIGVEKKRDEYWEWLADIRKYRNNIEKNTTHLLVEKRRVSLD